jgi:hypothetical protein
MHSGTGFEEAPAEKHSHKAPQIKIADRCGRPRLSGCFFGRASAVRAVTWSAPYCVLRLQESGGHGGCPQLCPRITARA